MVTTSSWAQTVAAPGTSTVPPKRDEVGMGGPVHPDAVFANVSVHGGRVYDGWLARVEAEGMMGEPAPKATPLLGVALGLEAWGHSGDWGIAMPFSVNVGLRVSPLRITLGGGIDLVAVDRVADDTGVGFYSPLACANVGFDVFGIRLGVDGRVVRRWQIGAADFTQWQLAAFVGKTFDPPARRRITPARVAW
ncbi:MAG: hypothetical protein AB7P03_16145 [Kofleriaceae bacterium]